MSSYKINHTSADDLASSLRLWNPATNAERSDMINRLRDAVDDEAKNKNRATVIKMLNRKIVSLRTRDWKVNRK